VVELAAAVGVNPDTILCYERAGLLPAPSRTAAGYRAYDRRRSIGSGSSIEWTVTSAGAGRMSAARSLGADPHVFSLRDRVAVEGPFG
jgi:hypothetical protein